MHLCAVDGIELEYEVTGAGESVVLIHGGYVADAFLPLRRSAALRAMVRETVLTPSDFIEPFFVVEGRDVRNPIASRRCKSGDPAATSRNTAPRPILKVSRC